MRAEYKWALSTLSLLRRRRRRRRKMSLRWTGLHGHAPERKIINDLLSRLLLGSFFRLRNSLLPCHLNLALKRAFACPAIWRLKSFVSQILSVANNLSTLQKQKFFSPNVKLSLWHFTAGKLSSRVLMSLLAHLSWYFIISTCAPETIDKSSPDSASSRRTPACLVGASNANNVVKAGETQA